MAAEQFNSLGGFSVGIPPTQVIDANGNVVTNVFTTGNVSANVIFATDYRFANGNPIAVDPGGTNGQLQFNSDGSFGGTSGIVWDGSKLVLDKSTLKLLGGENGYFLQTDGTGNLTWSPGGGGGANGNPGGANTQVQYNKAGDFGGDAGFTYNDQTDRLTVKFITVDTITGNIVGTASFANTAGVVTLNAQPNITSVGTLTSLNISGSTQTDWLSVNNAISANSLSIASDIATANLEVTGEANISQLNASQSTIGNLTVSGNAIIQGVLFAPQISVNAISAFNSTVTGTANILGTLNSSGVVNFVNSSQVNLGNISNIKIPGGINGYVLTTDGTGNLAWSAGGAGGNGVPGGTNTQVQFNDDGSFAGDPFLTFNKTSKRFTVAGELVANTITIGSGAFQFSKSNVFFATTVTTSNTALISLNANAVSSVDFTVIATDNQARKRQVSKLSAVMYDETVNYNEYSTLFVNDLVGDFSVAYKPGDAVNPPSVTLYVTPETSNMSIYKIQITVYDE